VCFRRVGRGLVTLGFLDMNNCHILTEGRFGGRQHRKTNYR
jgi:hypothetical protein